MANITKFYLEQIRHNGEQRDLLIRAAQVEVGSGADAKSLPTVLAGKQDVLSFGSAYNAETNKAATMADIAGAFKSLNVSGHTVSFYGTTDKTGSVLATMDFPTEMFLDQTKTKFVDKFTWSEEAYPGSTNPNLNNKPVMVLAVRGDADGDNNPDNDTVSYSFLNMAKLVDTYAAKVEGKDGSTTVTVEGYEIEVAVNISTDEDNILTTDANGKLKVPKTDISGKADKVAGDGAKTDEILTADADGNIQASGKKVGGATFADTPNANTAATEAGVADAIAKQDTATPSTSGVGGTKGLMSATDKERLDGLRGVRVVEGEGTAAPADMQNGELLVRVISTSQD